jgi:chemotaxis protein CheY-P-specific phosphatase CheC
LTVSPEGVETLLDTLLPGSGMDQSAVEEVGNVVTSGFIDGWADHLETTIDVSPPRYVNGTGAELLDATGFDRDQAFVFRSQVAAVGEELDVQFYMFPERDSMREMLSGGDDEIPVEKLTTLKAMARSGAETASESVSEMTGIDTHVDVTQLSFVPVEDVPGELRDQKHVGTVLEFQGAPGGYVLILFDEASGREIVAELVPGTNDVESFDGMEQSAMEEMGNVITSSFVDGWANVLNTTIDISTPQFTYGAGSKMVEKLVGSRRDEMALVFDSRVHARQGDVEVKVYTFPELAELVELMQQIEI